MTTATAEAPPVAQTPHFRVGTYEVEQTDYDEQKTMDTGTVNFPTYNPAPNDWLSGIWFMIECVAAGNSANVAFKEDGPFCGIDHVTFKDTGNQNVFGPISGYDWENVMKLGGYFNIGDPRSDITFSAITGTGATGGSFTIIMYLPLEFVHRESLGTVENKSTSTSYTVELTLGKSTDLYSTAPTNQPTVRIRTTLDGYTEPRAMDEITHQPLAEAPPAAGTLQYWKSENEALNAGSQSNNQRNGLGFAIRNIIFKYVDANGSRLVGDGYWPDPVALNFGRITLFERQKKLWQSRMGKAQRWTSANTDVSQGRENGVYHVWFTDDFGFQPGAEMRNGYLITQVGNQLEWVGTTGGAGTLYTMTNWIVPPGNNTSMLRAR